MFKSLSDPKRASGASLGFLVGVIFASLDLSGRATDPKHMNVRQLLGALKDPELTNRIIEKLKEPEMADLLTDPIIVKDIDTLDNVVTKQVNDLFAAKLQELEDRKALLQDVAPKQGWAKKAIDKASKLKTTERE